MESVELLKVTSLSVKYPDAKTPTLRDVDLALRSAEITCVIGESGCGKSTLFHAMMQLPGRVEITEGGVCFRGKDLRNMTKQELREMRGRGIGVVFQEPGASLDPIRKIRAQFYEAMRAHNKKVTKEDAGEKAASILSSMEFKDPERILNSCPAQLSGGMNQRVAIALAMALDPDVLLCDEPTSALDVTVQAQIVEELIRLRDRFHTCIFLITHNMGVVAKMADYVAVMYGGRMVEYGTKEEVLQYPAHPYTRALLEAIPALDGTPPKGIPGRRPDKFVEEGCAFAPRCACSSQECAGCSMEKIHLSENHWTLCGKEAENCG